MMHAGSNERVQGDVYQRPGLTISNLLCIGKGAREGGGHT